MRFKRVSNYSEMDSMEAFIIDLLNKDKEKDEIIEAIVQNFGFDEIVLFVKYFDMDGDGKITMDEIEAKIQESNLAPGMSHVPQEILDFSPSIYNILAKRTEDTQSPKKKEKKNFLAFISEKYFYFVI